MKFHNSKKGFIGVLALVLIVAVLSGGGVYLYQKQKLSTTGNYEYPATSTKADLATEVNPDSPLKAPDHTVLGMRFTEDEANNTMTATLDGNVIQTFTLDRDGVLASFEAEKSDQKAFITDKDMNFDGYADVGVIAMSGYGGVNLFYTYYLYNPETKTFDLNKDLQSVVIVSIDAEKKQLVNSYRSGPVYTTQTLTWTGTGYTKTDFKPVEMESDSFTAIDASFSKYKNTQFGFETWVSTKLLKPTVRTGDTLVFQYRNQKFGGQEWVGSVTVHKMKDRTIGCEWEAIKDPFTTEAGYTVEHSAFGDAGYLAESYKISSGNATYCVERSRKMETDVQIKGMTTEQYNAMIQRLDSDLGAIADTFVEKFIILK